MIPYTIIVLIAWLIFFAAWYLLGIPLGPGTACTSERERRSRTRPSEGVAWEQRRHTVDAQPSPRRVLSGESVGIDG